jgi:hypothetical protein
MTVLISTRTIETQAIVLHQGRFNCGILPINTRILYPVWAGKARSNYTSDGLFGIDLMQ